MVYGSPLLAIALMLIGGFLVFFALGVDPIEGFTVYFYQPVSDIYGIAELFFMATPLMLCAIGLAIGFRANVWNIGAEGQFIVGAICASAVALWLDHWASPWVLFAMVIAGGLGGILWAAIPALLKTEANTNEILVSLMLVYVAQLLVSYLVHGPMMDPMGFNFPQSRMFEEPALLPVLIEGTRLNAALLFALSALLVGYVFMQRSFLGYQMRVAGFAPNAARYAGFSTRYMVWIGLLAGGCMAGIAGMTQVSGPMGQVTEHISQNYGFAAIIVAFIGRLHALGILFGALLMALLYLGGEQAQQYLNLPSAIANVFQGMLLFFLLGADVLIAYRIRWLSASKTSEAKH